MATGSKHETKRRGIITATPGDFSVAFGPNGAGDPVIRLRLIEVLEAGSPPVNVVDVAIELDRARDLRNTLNAVIGLMAVDERSS